MRDHYDKRKEFWAFHFIYLAIIMFFKSLFDWFLIGARKDIYDREIGQG